VARNACHHNHVEQAKYCHVRHTRRDDKERTVVVPTRQDRRARPTAPTPPATTPVETLPAGATNDDHRTANGPPAPGDVHDRPRVARKTVDANAGSAALDFSVKIRAAED